MSLGKKFHGIVLCWAVQQESLHEKGKTNKKIRSDSNILTSDIQVNYSTFQLAPFALQLTFDFLSKNFSLFQPSV